MTGVLAGHSLKPGKNWLALPVGNEGPSTFTGWYIGDGFIPSFPTKGQLEKH